MKKDLSKLSLVKRFATCALAVAVVATSTPSEVAYATATVEDVDTVVTDETNEEISTDTQVLDEEITVVDDSVVESTESESTEVESTESETTQELNDETNTDSNSEESESETIEEADVVTLESQASEADEEEAEEEEEEAQVYTVSEGYYLASAEFWHATNAALSSANSSLVSTYLDVDENGIVTVYLNLKSLGSVWVDDVNYLLDGEYVDAEISKTDDDGNPTQWKFVLPENTEYTNIQVGYDTGSSWGRMTHNLRLKIDFDNLTQVYQLDAGYYSANAQFIKEAEDVLSSANSALVSTYLDVDEEGIATVYLNLKSLGSVWVDDVNYLLDGEYADAEISKTDAAGNPTQWKFILPENTEYINIQVGYDTGSSWGRMTHNARLKIDYDDLSVVNINFGEDNVKLYPGIYLVPVSLMNANTLVDASMAGLALESIAYLTVSNTGEAVLQTKWKSLQVGSVNANLIKLSIFQNENTSNNNLAEEATVDTYRVFESVQVPEKISFQIPSDMKNKNGVYVYTETDINHNNAAYLKIDYSNAEALVINKVELGKALSNAKSITNTTYVTSSFTKLEEAINEAQSVYDNELVIQTEIDSQVTALTNAINGLVTKSNKTALSEALTKAKAISNDNGVYIASSFAKLTAAITQAQSVYDTEAATQSSVDAQVTALTNAINALQKSGISLNQTAATIYTKIGTTTVQLTATVTGDNQSVTYTSSNNDVATVSSSGLVTAKEAGTTTITATANGISATCEITVKAPSLTLKASSGTVAVGGKITIEATSDPAGTITYKTSNKKVATVTSKGVVKGIKAGTAKITVTSNGISKTYKVTVKKQTLTLKKSSGTITVGNTISIKATASPTGTVKYKSSNKKVATVTSDGVVKGVKAGTANITVSINGVSKTYKVTVKKQTLTLKKTSATVKVGKTVSIKATASPSGKVTYKSSNEEIATVTSKGVVKGIKKGKATITVSCNGVTKKFKVTIK